MSEINNLPPLGSTVRIVSVGLPVWPEAEKFFGADCTLCAVFMTGDTQMVAVEHQADAVCCCFVAEMVRTPEQAAAEAKQKEIRELAGLLSGHDQHIAQQDMDMAAFLYSTGYRKQVSP